MHSPARRASPLTLRPLVAALLAPIWVACASVPESAALPDHTRSDLLLASPVPYERIVCQLDVVAGCEPGPRTPELLRELLALATGKAVQVVQHAPLPVHAVRDLAPHALAQRRLEGPEIGGAAPGEAAYLYALIYDSANLRSNLRIPKDGLRPQLNTNYPLAIYVDMAYLRAVARGNPGVEARDLVSAMLAHEAGHALGLVRSRAHGDGAHCNIEGCLMQAVVQASSASALEGNGALPQAFCAACRADLSAARAGPPAAELSLLGPVIVRRGEGYWVLLCPSAAYLSFIPPQDLDWRGLVRKGDEDFTRLHAKTGPFASIKGPAWVPNIAIGWMAASIDPGPERTRVAAGAAAAKLDADPLVRLMADLVEEALAAELKPAGTP